MGEFIIYTDQRSLVHLGDQRLDTAWQQKVFTKLLGLQYRIMYKPSTTNRVADALSRRGHSEELCAVSASVPSWMTDIQGSYASDAKAQALLMKLVVSASAEPHFSLHNDILRYKGRIWVGANKTLQQ